MTNVVRGSLAAASWVDNDSRTIHLYYAAIENKVKERIWDDGNGWRDGDFVEDCVQGSKVVALPGPRPCVLLQRGISNSLSGVTMYVQRPINNNGALTMDGSFGSFSIESMPSSMAQPLKYLGEKHPALR
jgi:hypothetical protein